MVHPALEVAFADKYLPARQVTFVLDVIAVNWTSSSPLLSTHCSTFPGKTTAPPGCVFHDVTDVPLHVVRFLHVLSFSEQVVPDEDIKRHLAASAAVVNIFKLNATTTSVTNRDTYRLNICIFSPVNNAKLLDFSGFSSCMVLCMYLS